MLQDLVTVGLDLAKNVFQIHAIDEAGGVVVRRQLRRTEVLKFFAAVRRRDGSLRRTSRELMELGHEVRLMPPAYVKPFGAPDGALPVEEVIHPENCRLIW
jgi:transposase